jgi:hypothetical protein
MFVKKKDLKKVRFENGDAIPDIESYFCFNRDDDDSDDDGENNVNNDDE